MATNFHQHKSVIERICKQKWNYNIMGNCVEVSILWLISKTKKTLSYLWFVNVIVD